MKALLLTCALVLTACNKQIQDFVKGGGDNDQTPRAPAAAPVLQTGTLSMQISPGAGQMTGANNTAQVSFAHKDITVSGANNKVTFSFHQNRPQ